MEAPMTGLCEMIMECRAIGIDDRVILYGWAAQLEEGNDILFCSKETVAVFLGVGISTVQRRTKNLIAQGWLIDTGDKKQFDTGLLPVYIMNVPMIVGILEVTPFKLTDKVLMVLVLLVLGFLLRLRLLLLLVVVVCLRASRPSPSPLQKR
jgi:hypothetical protein